MASFIHTQPALSPRNVSATNWFDTENLPPTSLTILISTQLCFSYSQIDHLKCNRMCPRCFIIMCKYHRRRGENKCPSMICRLFNLRWDKESCFQPYTAIRRYQIASEDWDRRWCISSEMNKETHSPSFHLLRTSSNYSKKVREPRPTKLCVDDSISNSPDPSTLAAFHHHHYQKYDP